MTTSDNESQPPDPAPPGSSADAETISTPTPDSPTATEESQPTEATAPAKQNGKRQRWFGIRTDIPTWASVLAGICCIASVALLWWFVTWGEAESRVVGPTQLPSPAETWRGVEDVSDSETQLWLVGNTLVSLRRLVIGFLLAVAVGVPIGVLAGCFPLVRSLVSPLVLFGRNVPIAALIPLMYALVGTGEGQKYAFIFVACLAFIVADTIDAISEVAQRYIDTAMTLGASRFQIVMKVLVPLAMPMVFNSLRVMFGLAFGYIMLVESIHDAGEIGGLGSMVNTAQRQGLRHIPIIVILTIPFVAWLIDQCLFVFQCWVFRWKYAEEAERSWSYRLAKQVVKIFWNPARKQAAA